MPDEPLDGGPPEGAADLDPAEAARALCLPGRPRYRGPARLPLLAEALDGVPLPQGALDRRAGPAPAQPSASRR